MSIRVELQNQKLSQNEAGMSQWRLKTWGEDWDPRSTALILCDVWDGHWCRGAVERLGQMIPKMNEVVSNARLQGVFIIHAPSDTMDFYRDSAALRRMEDFPSVDPPSEIGHEDPSMPVDASDNGSDTGETKTHKAWTRQHPGIDIDVDRDGITDKGALVHNATEALKIDHLLIAGVHTNMCVLNRTFAIKQMVRWGKQIALIRDLTDAMYNPAMPPYVSHEDGTRLVIEYIEKFWCPTTTSDSLL